MILLLIEYEPIQSIALELGTYRICIKVTFKIPCSVIKQSSNFWSISIAAKALASLRICPGSPEPSFSCSGGGVEQGNS